MNDYDVLVVGGGPIGAAAARHAAEAGAVVLLAERRASFGGPSACTGLVSPRALPTLGVSSRSILRRIRAVTAHAPNGHRLTLRSEEVKAVVIDRRVLEQELIERARESGATVALETNAIGLTGRDASLRTRCRTETVKATVVIGADGPQSAVARWGHLPSPTRILNAAQVVLDHPAPEEDGVEVHFGKRVAPGFFAWAVPAEPGRLRVGLAAPSPADPLCLLRQLIADRYPRGQVISSVGGWIPVRAVSRSTGDGVLLVGDAAGQVKPLSGGGLYVGALCARLAGETAARAALSGEPGRGSLLSYDEAWRRAIRTELKFGEMMQSSLAAMTDTEINAAFAGADDPDLLQFVADAADIDRLSRLVPDLLSNRRMWKRLFSLFPWVAGLPSGSRAPVESLASASPRSTL